MPDESRPERDDERARRDGDPSGGRAARKGESRGDRSAPRRDERKPYVRGERKPVARGERKPPERGERKPSERGERTPYDRGERKPYERRGERKPSEQRERKPYDRSDRADRADRGAPQRRSHGGASGAPRAFTRDGGGRPPRDPDSAPRHEDPPVPDDVAANQLDRVARGELKTLSKDNADWVARHLVMVGRLIDDDPELAHTHALAAARRAGRIGVVRETTAITAYATGDFALAIRELRTYRRISGRDDQLPLMVDSERGVGRPQAALELGRSVPRESLEPSVQVALAIAMSGARLDLEQPDLALTELQIPQLDPERAFSYSPALFDAYATVLEELGRETEAEEWWARSERASLALERAATPEGQDTIEIVEEDAADDDAADDSSDEDSE